MRRIVALVLTALVVAGVGAVTVAAPVSAGSGADKQGITKDEIRIGGVASPPSVLNVPYQDGFAGAKAYFDKVNKEGGLFGRDIKLVAQLSDQGAPFYDARNATALADLGIPAFACTPDLFPGLMAAAIQKPSLELWAARNGIVAARAPE